MSATLSPVRANTVVGVTTLMGHTSAIAGVDTTGHIVKIVCDTKLAFLCYLFVEFCKFSHGLIRFVFVFLILQPLGSYFFIFVSHPIPRYFWGPEKT